MVVRSEKTTQSYAKLLKSIQMLLDINDTTLDWLLDYKNVIPAIDNSTYADNTKKLMFVAIKSTLRDSGDGRFHAILKFYDARMMDFAEKTKEAEDAQKLNPTEAKKYIDWNKVLSVRETLRVGVEKLLETDDGSVELMNAMQNYIILCLYTMIEPVRLDFAEMMVVPKKPANPVGNYLIWNKRPYFLFTKYKTASKYGKVIRRVPLELMKVLEWWLSMNPTGFLLIDKGGNAMTDVGLCHRVISIFTKQIGKTVGVSQLRHSYITYMRGGEMPLKEQQEMANNMMHSVGMSVKYRKIE